jgi:hypothetical protein
MLSDWPFRIFGPLQPAKALQFVAKGAILPTDTTSAAHGTVVACNPSILERVKQLQV